MHNQGLVYKKATISARAMMCQSQASEYASKLLYCCLRNQYAVPPPISGLLYEAVTPPKEQWFTQNKPGGHDFYDTKLTGYGQIWSSSAKFRQYSIFLHKDAQLTGSCNIEWIRVFAGCFYG